MSIYQKANEISQNRSVLDIWVRNLSEFDLFWVIFVVAWNFEFLRSENFGTADFLKFGENDFLRSGRFKISKKHLPNSFLHYQDIVFAVDIYKFPDFDGFCCRTSTQILMSTPKSFGITSPSNAKVGFEIWNRQHSTDGTLAMLLLFLRHAESIGRPLKRPKTFISNFVFEKRVSS
jgi:hypothetical protein